MEFAKWLATARRAAKVPQRELEENLGKGAAYITRLEQGSTPPGEQACRALALALGADPDEVWDMAARDRLRLASRDDDLWRWHRASLDASRGFSLTGDEQALLEAVRALGQHSATAAYGMAGLLQSVNGDEADIGCAERPPELAVPVAEVRTDLVQILSDAALLPRGTLHAVMVLIGEIIEGHSGLWPGGDGYTYRTVEIVRGQVWEDLERVHGGQHREGRRLALVAAAHGRRRQLAERRELNRMYSRLRSDPENGIALAVLRGLGLPEPKPGDRQSWSESYQEAQARGLLPEFEYADGDIPF